MQVAGAAGQLTGTAVGLATGITQTIDFWTDPWGNTFKALESAAHGLAESVLPTVTRATLPDLNATWFLSAYAVAFALAILLAVVLLIPQILRTARGLQSGRELAESVGIYFPLFLIGAMFGPVAGVLLVNFFQALSDSIIRWGVAGSADTVTTKFQSMLTADDATGIAGGAPVGVLLMLLMLAGLLLVVVMLVVQLVTLYFTGVLLPLGLVWIIDPLRRRTGTRIATIWIGILASHPLLFFLLAIAYLMVAGSVNAFGNNASLSSMVQLIVSVLALFLAGLSPFVLMKLAPVLPGGSSAGAGPALTGLPIGAQNLSDADSRASSTPPPPASSGTAAGSASPPDSQSEPAAALSAAAGAADTDPDQSAPAPAAAEPSPKAVPNSAVARPAASETTAAATTARATATNAAATTAGEGLVAVGGAESATGVGALVGVPTLVAGAALTGADLLQGAVDTVGDQAASTLDDHDPNPGGFRG